MSPSHDIPLDTQAFAGLKPSCGLSRQQSHAHPLSPDCYSRKRTFNSAPNVGAASTSAMIPSETSGLSNYHARKVPVFDLLGGSYGSRRRVGKVLETPFAEEPNRGRGVDRTSMYGEEPLQLPSRGGRLMAAEGSEGTESDVRGSVMNSQVQVLFAACLGSCVREQRTSAILGDVSRSNWSCKALERWLRYTCTMCNDTIEGSEPKYTSNRYGNERKKYIYVGPRSFAVRTSRPASVPRHLPCDPQFGIGQLPVALRSGFRSTEDDPLTNPLRAELAPAYINAPILIYIAQYITCSSDGVHSAVILRACTPYRLLNRNDA